MKKQPDVSENRKALPLFLVIMAASLLLGLLLGFASVRADGDTWQNVFRAALNAFFTHCTPWLLLAVFVLSLSFGLHGIFHARRQLAVLNDEEAAFRTVDQTLSRALNLTNGSLMISYFLLGALLCYLHTMSLLPFVVGLGSFVGSLISGIIIQQHLIDLAKTLYPEKRGSVYDVKFQQKWFESCDEAERATIAQAALSSYKTTNTVCCLLWLLLILAHMFFEAGLLPIFAISLIWFISFVSYAHKAGQLDRTGLQ